MGDYTTTSWAPRPTLRVKVTLAQWSVEADGDAVEVTRQIEAFYAAVRGIALGQSFADALRTAAEAVSGEQSGH